ESLQGRQKAIDAYLRELETELEATD
ncbi:MAG: hypothetical protein QOJ29_2343, partial [Thermoleophilaceae bacterium]|nr:hypothetical protein [Thermoleophilaceae bacterium]